jgi:hypothetical protein
MPRRPSPFGPAKPDIDHTTRAVTLEGTHHEQALPAPLMPDVPLLLVYVLALYSSLYFHQIVSDRE